MADGVFRCPSRVSCFFVVVVFFIFVTFFYWCSFTWDHMGEHISNDIASESTHQIHSQKSCILLGRVSTKVVQRIVNFQILGFAILFSLTWDHMGKSFK